MAKISRKKMTRGGGLMVEHFADPIGDVQDVINNINVEQEQLDRGYSTFRVDLWTPHVASQFIGPAAGYFGDKPYSIPFMLPPTQDLMDINPASGGYPTNYQLSERTPHPVLSELHFSFDQRGEGAAITDQFHNPGVNDWPAAAGRLAIGGQLDYLHAPDVLNFSIALVEKTPEIFLEDANSVATQPDKEVFSYDIPADAFIGASFRLNPLVVYGINRPLNPYKSYTALLYCNGLWKTGDRNLAENLAHALVSCTIQLKFKMRLLSRDIHENLVTEVQNIPAIHDGNPIPFVASSTFPVAGDPIEADTTPGVNFGILTVEDTFRRKMRGGYTDRGDVHPTQIEDDAAYEVITVPLFANNDQGGLSHASVGEEPYFQAGVSEEFWDRGIVPLDYPFVLHHAILAWNWQTWGRGYSAPGVALSQVGYIPRTTSTYIAEIGVNIGAGLRSDLLGFQNIAQLQMVDPLEAGGSTWLNNLIDRIRVHEPLMSIQNGGLVQRQWDLFQIPIVGSVLLGAGFFTNGSPVWCSPSDQSTAWNSRVAAGTGREGLNVGAPPVLQGMEQFLEVRARLRFAANEGTGAVDDILVGYGGHRVYLIGKKHLVGKPRV